MPRKPKDRDLTLAARLLVSPEDEQGPSRLEMLRQRQDASEALTRVVAERDALASRLSAIERDLEKARETSEDHERWVARIKADRNYEQCVSIDDVFQDMTDAFEKAITLDPAKPTSSEWSRDAETARALEIVLSRVRCHFQTGRELRFTLANLRRRLGTAA